MRSSWVKVSLLNFFVASVMGLLLRYVFIGEIPWMDYRNMLHAHSHVAMLGWVYLILYAYLIDFFVPSAKQTSPFYNRLFWFTQFTVLGMMVSFPLQGYGAVSITFSSLHIIGSYLFSWGIWKDMEIRDPNIRLMVRSSIAFLVISTFGIWCMGPVMALQLRNDPIYMVVVQFYLHFQFNGWFAMAVLALVMFQLHQWNIRLSEDNFKKFYWFYVSGLLLTFYHILHWAYLEDYMYYLNSVGVVLQAIAFLLLCWPLRKTFLETIKTKSLTAKSLLAFALGSLLAKVIFQAVLIFPEVTEISTTIRQFMVGYIHLTMLGFITGFILWLLHQQSSIYLKSAGIHLFLIGYMVTEGLLFVQGISYWSRLGTIPYYHELLCGFSLLLPIGLFIMVFWPSFNFSWSKDPIQISETLNKY